MARALWSGAIAFGLVNIPVKLYGATESKDLSFTTLHASCMTALKRPYICPKDNVPVDAKDMVKGYEFAKGQYVIMKDEDFDKIQLVAISPQDGGLVLTTLMYQDEVKPPPEPPATQPIVISDAEIELALQLIRALTMDLDVSKFRDRYRDALMALIQAKVEGKELPAVVKSETKPTQDLMAALKASLEAAKAS